MKNIKELIEKSGIDFRHIEKYADEDFQQHLEDFAKNLIKECAIIGNRAENNENELSCMYDVITGHFGIKN